ncbi:PLP-dependent aminotransferase family protein [Azotosporobacter soli]|uniref:aminotransferase-like domain-containing protein n=1 Tax=Azotosporobacter soli TaxID=3055040 RepID=UPI0031FF33B9
MDYKYEVVADSIRREIASGAYKAGAKLPSIKAMSRQLRYNADTIIAAYKQLEAQHLIYAVPKSGYYVMKQGAADETEKSVLNLASLRLPDDINPYKDYYHCMEKAIGLYEKKLFDYAQPKGLAELTRCLVKHLTHFQIFTRQENIFITSGAQQALYILAGMPFGKGKTKVLTEQPTYAMMLQILQCTKTPIAGVRRSAAGLDLRELEAHFKEGDVKFFYTMPRYQNPTGFSYAKEQKQEILRLAKKYDVYIVEDDYLADLELDAKASSLYAMDAQAPVIYIKSFSKTLLPGLRLGMCIVPPALHAAFLTQKNAIDLGTSILTQGALEIYLKSSMYKFHVQKTKKYYKTKMDEMRSACAALSSERMHWHVPESGIFLYAELNGISAAMLEKKLALQGILVSTLASSYMNGARQTEGLRLCVGNMKDISVLECITREAGFLWEKK